MFWGQREKSKCGVILYILIVTFDLYHYHNKASRSQGTI